MKGFDGKKIEREIVNFLTQTFKTAGFSDAVIGVSGGVDSAVVFALSVKALGADHVYPILLPYGMLSTQSTLDSMAVIEKFAVPLPHITRIDIKNAVDTISRDLGTDTLRRGNIMARVRMTYLFDQAKKRNALVVGTENRSEYLLGYFTRFGDEASDVEPIMHLYKTQVYELGKVLEIPQSILDKPPSANLWPEQTDEKEFGFTYKDADQILAFLYDEKKTIDEVAAFGFDRDLILRVKQYRDRNAFKHALPYALSTLL